MHWLILLSATVIFSLPTPALAFTCIKKQFPGHPSSNDLNLVFGLPKGSKAIMKLVEKKDYLGVKKDQMPDKLSLCEGKSGGLGSQVCGESKIAGDWLVSKSGLKYRIGFKSKEKITDCIDGKNPSIQKVTIYKGVAGPNNDYYVLLEEYEILEVKFISDDF